MLVRLDVECAWPHIVGDYKERGKAALMDLPSLFTGIVGNSTGRVGRLPVFLNLHGSYTSRFYATMIRRNGTVGWGSGFASPRTWIDSRGKSVYTYHRPL